MDRHLDALAEAMHLPAEISVEAATSAVLGVLAARLTATQAEEVRGSLSPPYRDLFDHCAPYEGGPAGLISVAEQLAVTPPHAELICAAVFAAIGDELPADVRALWCRLMPNRAGEHQDLGPHRVADVAQARMRCLSQTRRFHS